MTKPDIIPEKIKSKINPKIILLIIGISTLYHIGLINEMDSDKFDLYDIINPSYMLVTAIASFFVAKNYSKSIVFGKSYFYLGIGFLMLFIGDVTYIVYEQILFEDPYPSVADIFFFSFYIFTLIHLILNIHFFMPKINIPAKIWLIAIPIFLISIYAYTSFIEFEEANFDFYYGLIFVSGASIILAHSILGAAIFRFSLMGTIWLLLAIGIFIQSFTDVWYYYLEIFGFFTSTHITNTLWLTSSLVITYALYKHTKEI